MHAIAAVTHSQATRRRWRHPTPPTSSQGIQNVLKNGHYVINAPLGLAMYIAQVVIITFIAKVILMRMDSPQANKVHYLLKFTVTNEYKSTTVG